MITYTAGNKKKKKKEEEKQRVRESERDEKKNWKRYLRKGTAGTIISRRVACAHWRIAAVTRAALYLSAEFRDVLIRSM